MHTILVASNNAHKLQELREIIALARVSDAIRLITPNDLALSLDPNGTADTYEGNALLKARAFAGALRSPTSNPSLVGRGRGRVRLCLQSPRTRSFARRLRDCSIFHR